MSKFQKFISLASRSIALLLLAPSIALAIGFGNLGIHSQLGEGLRLEIDLLSITPAEIGSMTVGLSSLSDYTRAEIPYPQIAHLLRFKIVESDGKFRIAITSEDPITVSFFHLLITATWSGGKIVREYTALLDPPQYTGESPAVVTVVGGDGGSEQKISSSASTTTGSSGESASKSPAIQSTMAVMRGDTLSGIVNSLGRPESVSLVQGLTAILEANPTAFADGNMNRLLAGASLKIPDFVKMALVNKQQALQNFRSQVAQYDQYLVEIGFKSLDAKDGDMVVELESSDANSDQIISETASIESSPEIIIEVENQPEIESSEAVVSLETVPQDDARLSIGQEASDEDIASAITGSAGDAAQVEALKNQLAQLDETLLTTGMENEEVKQRIKDIQSQVDRVTKLIEVENAGLAISQERAATNDTEDSVTAIAEIEQQTGDDQTKISGTGTESEYSQDGIESLSIDNTSDNGNVGISGSESIVSEGQSIAIPATSVEPATTGENDVVAQSDTTTTTTTTTAATPIVADSSGVQEIQQSSEPERLVVQTSIMDSITEIFGSVSGYVLKIAAALIVLIAGLFFYRRRKSKEEFEESMLDIESGQISEISEQRSSTKLDKDSGIELASPDSSLDLTEGAGMSYLSEQGVAGVAKEDNEVVQTGTVDPMAEAEVYLAYDRDEQAVQVLKEAYSINPGRPEFAEKLLEIYHKQDDRAAFDDLATKFYVQAGNKKNSDWPKIAAMGKEVSPDNKLYDELSEFQSISSQLNADSENSAADAIKTLNLENGEFDLDVERAKDPAVTTLETNDYEPSVADKSEPDFSLDTPALSHMIAAAEKNEILENSLHNRQQSEQNIEDIKFDLEDDEFDLDVNETAELSDTITQLDVEKADSDVVQEDSYLSQIIEMESNSSEPYHESETALELAKAYLELGEKDIAKKFIEEVINDGSDSQKAKAKKLFKELLD